jgi:hypothetical protein
MAGESLEITRGRVFMYVGERACVHMCVYMYVMYAFICNCSNRCECLLCAVLTKWYWNYCYYYCCYYYYCLYCYCSIACDACSRTFSSLSDRPVCEGIPVLQPSRFYPCPSGRDNFKAVRGLDNWIFCLALCLQNVWFISVERLATFAYVVGVFLPSKFKLIYENFKMVS